MKKVILSIIFLLIFFCSSLCASASDKKYHRPYLGEYYDVSTYQYDPKTKTHSFDVICDILDEEFIKSPYDENYIYFLILNIKYNFETEETKVAYKGFVSAHYYKKNGKIKRDKIRFYYDNNESIVPYSKSYMEYWEKLGTYGDSTKCVEKQVIKNLYKAYLNSTLYELPENVSSLEL